MKISCGEMKSGTGPEGFGFFRENDQDTITS
jgi:hypothetical protein